MPNVVWFVVLVVVVLWIFPIFGHKGERMDVHELKKTWLGGNRPGESVLIDVREDGEFRAGHVPGALNIPLGKVGEAKARLEPFKTVWVICQSGARSSSACQVLQGIFGPDKKVINIAGGTSAWVSAGYPLEK